MGHFHDLMNHLGDSHLVAKVRVELFLELLRLEIGDTKDEDLRKLLIAWLGG